MTKISKLSVGMLREMTRVAHNGKMNAKQIGWDGFEDTQRKWLKDECSAVRAQLDTGQGAGAGHLARLLSSASIQRGAGFVHLALAAHSTCCLCFRCSWTKDYRVLALSV
jgi:hypothetical protein